MAPGVAQEGPTGAEEIQIDLFGAKKTTNKNVVFAWDCLHFFALEILQDGPKRPRRLQKSMLMEFRDLQKKLQRLTTKTTDFGTIFGMILGSILGFKIL